LGIVTLMATLLVACGTELGRIPFTGLGSGETEVIVDASAKIDLWTQIKIKFEGDVALAYLIEMHQTNAL